MVGLCWLTKPEAFRDGGAASVHRGRATDASTLDFCNALVTSALPSILVPRLVNCGSDAGTAWRTRNWLGAHNIQGVVVNVSEAQWMSVTSGVPQGDSKTIPGHWEQNVLMLLLDKRHRGASQTELF